MGIYVIRKLLNHRFSKPRNLRNYFNLSPTSIKAERLDMI